MEELSNCDIVVVIQLLFYRKQFICKFKKVRVFDGKGGFFFFINCI